MNNCKKCGAFCPSGVLSNGLCSDCNSIGDIIMVSWGRFGMSSCKIDRVSKNGIFYAGRWNRKQGDWTAPRKIEFKKGFWSLA